MTLFFIIFFGIREAIFFALPITIPFIMACLDTISARNKWIAIAYHYGKIVGFICIIIFLLYHLYFVSDEYERIFILYTIFVMLLLVTTIFIWLLLYFLQAKNRRVALAYYDGKVVGVSLLEFRKLHSILLSLYVLTSHRNKGLGSYLVQYIINSTHEPIYLMTMPELFPFYKRLGFIETRKKRGYNMVYNYHNNNPK